MIAGLDGRRNRSMCDAIIQGQRARVGFFLSLQNAGQYAGQGRRLVVGARDFADFFLPAGCYGAVGTFGSLGIKDVFVALSLCIAMFLLLVLIVMHVVKIVNDF
jgi:hypothetical protein